MQCQKKTEMSSNTNQKFILGNAPFDFDIDQVHDYFEYLGILVKSDCLDIYSILTVQSPKNPVYYSF